MTDEQNITVDIEDAAAPAPKGPAPYTVSREDAAVQLEMSTRSVDRYIRRGKLRARKVGKMVWIHGQDLEVLRARGWQADYGDAGEDSPATSSALAVAAPAAPSAGLSEVLDALEKKMDEKDQLIQDLTYRLGKAEVELKNSVPLVDHKKVAFLLEDAKRNLDHERNEMENKVEDLARAVRSSSQVNALLLAAVLAALCTMGYMWYAGL